MRLHENPFPSNNDYTCDILIYSYVITFSTGSL